MRWMALGLTALMVGCGSSAPRDQTGVEEEVERSRDERPDWLGAPVCPQGRVCAVGNRTRATAVEHGRTDAYNDGLKDFARRLESRAKAKFSQGRQEGSLPEPGEAPDLDQAIKDFFVAASRLQVRDVKVSDFWWRRYRALGSDGRTRYYFDYAVQISLSEGAWKQTIQDLLRKERDKASNGRQQALVKAIDAFAADIFEEQE